MKTILKLCCIFLLSVGFVQAQDNGSGDANGSDTDYKPKKGDFTGAILFGRGNYLNNVGVPQAPGANSAWTVFGGAPFANTINDNSNSITNIAGGEARYFIKDNIAVKLVGGFINRNTPALQNIQQFYVDADGELQTGNDPSAPNAVWIPSYSSIREDQTTDLYITAGGEYHFPARFKRLSPYVGLNLNYYNTRRVVYDPTVSFPDSNGIDTDNINNLPLIVDVGQRQAKVNGFGFQLTGGADYYLLKGLYMGFEVRPVTFIYARSEQLPAPGLPALEAQNTTWALFSQTHFKIGIRI